MNGLVVLYRRNDRWLLQVSRENDAGFWSEVAAADLGTEPAAPEIGAAARAGLTGPAPEPPPAGRYGPFGRDGQLPGLVGLKSFTTFAKKALSVNAELRHGVVTVTPTRRAGTGFEERLADRVTLGPPAEVGDEQLGEALLAGLEVAATPQ